MKPQRRCWSFVFVLLLAAPVLGAGQRAEAMEVCAGGAVVVLEREVPPWGCDKDCPSPTVLEPDHRTGFQPEPSLFCSMPTCPGSPRRDAQPECRLDGEPCPEPLFDPQQVIDACSAVLGPADPLQEDRWLPVMETEVTRTVELVWPCADGPSAPETHQVVLPVTCRVHEKLVDEDPIQPQLRVYGGTIVGWSGSLDSVLAPDVELGDGTAYGLFWGYVPANSSWGGEVALSHAETEPGGVAGVSAEQLHLDLSAVRHVRLGTSTALTLGLGAGWSKIDQSFVFDGPLELRREDDGPSVHALARLERRITSQLHVGGQVRVRYLEAVDETQVEAGLVLRLGGP